MWKQLRTLVFCLCLGGAGAIAHSQHEVQVFNGAGARHLERSTGCMGTTFSMELYGKDPGVLEAAASDGFAELRRVDRMLSNYIAESEWSAINLRANRESVPVSPELFHLLRACVEYSEKSEGAFDITVGPLMKTWGFYNGSGRLPKQAEVRRALARVGYRHLRLDALQSSVRFEIPGMNLDPGGVGKGYAVDRIIAVLRREGIDCALVSAGGSSIYGLGAPPSDARGWKIDIQDPRSEKKIAAQVYLKNASISTSGNYEKFFWAEGKLYSHIMDPRTGYPSQGMLSVSVVAPGTLDSEVWAKPYYILGRSWTERHKPGDFKVFMCEDRAGAACAWLR